MFSAISFALLTALSLPSATLALPVLQSRENPPAQTRNEEPTPKAVQERNVEGAADVRTNEEFKQKREQLQQRIAERKAATAEKLAGKRAEQCREKEEKINAVLDNRVIAAERHYETFKAIEDKLAAFVTEKGVQVANANAFAIVLEQKRINASAQIASASATDFECATADATAPGRIVMDQVASQKQALIEYRDAIKDYAVAVRAAATPVSESENTNGEEQAQ